jgi:hypothetical protein
MDDRLRAHRSSPRVAMNPDVFITIVFVGIAVLAALSVLVFVVPNARREDARVARHEPQRAPIAEGSEREKQTATAKAGRDAAVH